MKLCVCIMWWTIDSYFEPKLDTAVTLKESCLPLYFDTLKLSISFDFKTICMKDSRSLNLQDLEFLADHISNTSYTHYLVTHGTYTMPDTARFIKAKLWDGSVKKVMFTWSMIPITWFSPSDAWFNLWYAIAKLETIDTGVYVAMNWKVFQADEVSKLITEGRFTSLFNW